MATFGMVCLAACFLLTVCSVIILFMATRAAKDQTSGRKKRATGTAGVLRLQLIGSLGVWLSALTLTACCLIMIVAFLTGDNTISYVAHQRSDSASDLAVLYKISGLWAGREGSLLFWAWLISIFSSIVAFKAWKSALNNNESKSTKTAANKKKASSDTSDGDSLGEASDAEESKTSEVASAKANRTSQKRAPFKQTPLQRSALDSAALMISQLVLLFFVAILTFDEGNRPFIATAADYLDASGQLTGNAALWGLNALLEHWAMAIHPPTLFIGYAGMTIPFSYALAALIVNDSSRAWVERSSRYALVSWLFLGAGIGLGAVWAYVVLGWGGYWGWDPVENASLLSWVVAVGLVHSMTIYRQRGTFKRWTVMLACLTFSFVIIGTFITRSGIVQSVHAFETNVVSLIIFGALIIIPVVAGIVGLLVRRNSFADEGSEEDEAESILSKDVAYYLNNVIMIVCTIFLAYMTLSSAFPSWMPFGGQSLSATAYNAIARPVGVLYCLIIAVCPLLAWKKTRAKDFFHQAWLPAIGAVVVFALLCFFFVTTLLPIYMQTLSQGGTNAQDLAEAGPTIYYFVITLLGFLAASLLVFNSLGMLVRAIRKRNLRVQTIGGFLSHLAIGVLIIGLIGSSMYVYQRSGYVPYDEETDIAAESFEVKNYTLTYVSNDIEVSENEDDVHYTVTFDVERDGVYLGQVSPSVQLVQSTGQQMLHASVLTLPTEDLFVVYNGVNNDGDFSLDVRINPLILCVWLGFGLLMLGTAVAAFGRRK